MTYVCFGQKDVTIHGVPRVILVSTREGEMLLESLPQVYFAVSVIKVRCCSDVNLRFPLSLSTDFVVPRLLMRY